jgi:hypothetical protein
LNSLRKRLDLLSRLGPRPLRIARYFAYVATRHVRRRKLRTNYGRLVAHPPQRATLVPAAIDLPLFEDLPGPLKDPALRMRAEAEEILAHRVDILGSGWTSLGPTIDWHRDFKSGYRWPCSFFQDVQATRLTDASDAKVPWELSRCHHLLTLARAYRGRKAWTTILSTVSGEARAYGRSVSSASPPRWPFPADRRFG